MTREQRGKLPPGLRVRNGRYHLRFQMAGVECSRTTGLRATERNLGAALRKLEQARQAFEMGVSTPKLQPKPFSSAADLYLGWKYSECRERPATAHRIATSMVSLREFFQQSLLHSITAGGIEDYKQWRRETGIKEITLIKDLRALSGLFQYGMRQSWCFRNAIAGVKMPSEVGAGRTHVVSAEEEFLYFAAAKPFPLLHDLCRIILDTGLRPSEVLALTAGDVNLGNHSLIVRKSKTAAGRRIVGIQAGALELLAARMKGQPPQARLFIGQRGGVKNLIHSLDLTHLRITAKYRLYFTIYEFRHTFATRLAARGCPLTTLAAILGHQKIEMIQRYVHVQQDSIAEWSGILPTPGPKIIDSSTSQSGENGKKTQGGENDN